MRCIYCLEEKESRFFNSREHVIPQCFGVFRDNLTLNKMVCDECNQYFGRNIENCLGRDSLEGIARYRFGINPKKMPFHKRLKFMVGNVDVLKGVQVIPLPPDRQRETNELKLISQVGFFNKRTGKYSYFSKEEIPTKEELERQGYELKNKEIVFYGDVQELVSILEKKGLNIEITEIKETILNQEPSKIPVLIKARIDRTLYRGLSKIVFNYLAYSLGSDFVLKGDFDSIRRFIRYDEGNGDEFFKVIKTPIFYKEKRFGKRWHDGHIIVIEWDNFNLDGRLAIFNSIVKLTYIVTLCKNYKGVWFPFHKGHYFDPHSKQIREIQNFKFLIYL